MIVLTGAAGFIGSCMLSKLNSMGITDIVIVDDFSDGVYVCRSEFESPEVDGEILVRHDSSVMGDVDPYSLVGEFITVRVTGADEYDLIADPVEF